MIRLLLLGILLVCLSGLLYADDYEYFSVQPYLKVRTSEYVLFHFKQGEPRDVGCEFLDSLGNELATGVALLLPPESIIKVDFDGRQSFSWNCVERKLKGVNSE